MKKDLNNEPASCPVCYESDSTPVIESTDFFLSGESFCIYSCQICGVRYTHPRPDEQTIGKYYQSQNYISHSASRKGISDSIYYIVRNFTITSKIRLLRRYNSAGNVLDIGCGTGEFMNEVKKSKFNVTGIEPNPEARNLAIKKYGLTVLDETDIENLTLANYDIITMWHVLEHVYDLNSRIIQINRLLSKNGILVVALPNFDSWDAGHYGKFWAAYDLPRHLYHFNQKSIIQLFQKNGFTCIKKKPMFFDSFYISMVSEKYKTGKQGFLKGIFMGLISNIWAARHQNNYSSLTYIFKANKT